MNDYLCHLGSFNDNWSLEASPDQFNQKLEEQSLGILYKLPGCAPLCHWVILV